MTITYTKDKVYTRRSEAIILICWQEVWVVPKSII